MRSTLMWRGGVCVRYVGAGRRAAVVTRQAGLAATASITPVPSTPYGPTSKISRSEEDSLEVAAIGVSFHFRVEQPDYSSGDEFRLFLADLRPRRFQEWENPCRPFQP